MLVNGRRTGHQKISLHLIVQLLQKGVTLAGRHGGRQGQSLAPLIPQCLGNISNRNTQRPQTGLSKQLTEDELRRCYNRLYIISYLTLKKNKRQTCCLIENSTHHKVLICSQSTALYSAIQKIFIPVEVFQRNVTLKSSGFLFSSSSYQFIISFVNFI